MSILTGETMDITKENIEKLTELFPDIVCDGKVDFDKLKQNLGEFVDDNIERYNFTWNGKGRALKLSQTPSMGTLRPCKKDSVDWDNTKNLYIEGDNLEVLKLLQKSYFGKVKMIYIDPPYNTNGDFVYPDSYTDPIGEYLKITGQIDGNGYKIGTNMDTDGRYHTKWLNLIYPRLRLARNFLSEDGLIVINIDEHEISNLQKIMIEIYGENNDLGTIIWDKRNPKGDAKGISVQHEYILIYAKNKDIFLQHNSMKRPKKNAQKIINKAIKIFNKIDVNFTLEDANEEFAEWISQQTNFSGGEKAYNRIDENGDVYQTVSMGWPNKKQAPKDYFVPLMHPITNKLCPVPERGWRNPSQTMHELLKANEIVFGKDETTQPRRKYLLKNNMEENIPSLIYYGGSDDDLLKQMGVPFETAKVVDIVTEHILSFTSKDDIIMDFFAGSGTTAHAVITANSIDGNNRKYILVQYPEIIDKENQAYELGFRVVSEITRKRLVAINEQYDNLDTGFKMFKLNSSNLKKWNPNDNPNESIEEYINNIVDNFLEDGRTELDVLYEIMLKLGLDINLPIEFIHTKDGDFYSVGYGGLMVCLADNITEVIAGQMINLYKKIQPAVWKVVFKDNGFASDSIKINIIEKFKCAGLKEEFFTTI